MSDPLLKSDQKMLEDSPNAISLPEIGGWSYALRLAGWGDDRPIWSGSCPCQSFSSAGTQHAPTIRASLANVVSAH